MSLHMCFLSPFVVFLKPKNGSFEHLFSPQITKHRLMASPTLHWPIYTIIHTIWTKWTSACHTPPSALPS